MQPKKFNLNEIANFDVGYWGPHLKEMLWLIEDFNDKYYFSSPNIKISHKGASLIVDIESVQGLVSYHQHMINSAIAERTIKIVSRICIRCGVYKGEPPSLTVKPSLCEKCRAKIVPEDYKNNKIICLTGKAGSGKDTVADYLVNKHGFVREAFADPLRDIVQLVLVADHDSVWDRNLRELPLRYLPNLQMLSKIVTNPAVSNKTADNIVTSGDDRCFWSVRKLLQFVGTEMFRNLIHRDIWVMNFVKRIEPGYDYVITDCRFPNELDWVRTNFGGKILFVEVERPGYDGKSVGLENHESERYKLPADAVIQNDGTLEDLYEKVEKLIQ